MTFSSIKRRLAVLMVTFMVVNSIYPSVCFATEVPLNGITSLENQAVLNEGDLQRVVNDINTPAETPTSEVNPTAIPTTIAATDMFTIDETHEGIHICGTVKKMIQITVVWALIKTVMCILQFALQAQHTQ